MARLGSLQSEPLPNINGFRAALGLLSGRFTESRRQIETGTAWENGRSVPAITQD